MECGPTARDHQSTDFGRGLCGYSWLQRNPHGGSERGGDRLGLGQYSAPTARSPDASGLRAIALDRPRWRFAPTSCGADLPAEQASRPYDTAFPYYGIHCSNHEWIPFQLQRITSDPGFPELPRPELPFLLYLWPRYGRLDKELAGDGGAGQPGQPAISVRKQRHGCPESLAVFADLHDPGDQVAWADAARLADQRHWAWQQGFAWAPNDPTKDDWSGTGENLDAAIPSPNNGAWQNWNYSGPTSAFSNAGTPRFPVTGRHPAARRGLPLMRPIQRFGKPVPRPQWPLTGINRDYRWHSGSAKRASSGSAHQFQGRLLHPEGRDFDSSRLRNAR